MLAHEMMERHGLKTSDVLCWEGRSKRKRGPPPVTFFEEFVQHDPWYVQELVRDVPKEEMAAACWESDFEVDSESGSEISAVSAASEDDSFSISASDLLSDECYGSDGSEGSASVATSECEEEESVSRSSEGE